MSLSFEEFVTKIQTLNSKGIENLRTKGITLPETATTEDIINAILDIEIGSSISLPFEVTATFESKRIDEESVDFEYRTIPTSDIFSFFNNVKEDDVYLMSIDGNESFEVTVMVLNEWVALFNQGTLSGAGYNTATNEFGIQMNEDEDLSGTHTVVFSAVE